MRTAATAKRRWRRRLRATDAGLEHESCGTGAGADIGQRAHRGTHGGHYIRRVMGQFRHECEVCGRATRERGNGPQHSEDRVRYDDTGEVDLTAVDHVDRVTERGCLGGARVADGAA